MSLPREDPEINHSQERDHILPRRMWDYANLKIIQLSVEEQAHLSACRKCLDFFRYCALSDSFEAAKKLAGSSPSAA